MKKKLLALFLSLVFLAACQKKSAVESIKEDSQLAVEAVQVVDQNLIEYSYAVPNPNGYAYQMMNDPSNSSNISPLNEDSSSQVILFTFDDAPQSYLTELLDRSYTLEMADIMEENNVNAIFFVNGMYTQDEESKAIVRKLYDRGF